MKSNVVFVLTVIAFFAGVIITFTIMSDENMKLSAKYSAVQKVLDENKGAIEFYETHKEKINNSDKADRTLIYQLLINYINSCNEQSKELDRQYTINKELTREEYEKAKSSVDRLKENAECTLKYY